MRTFKELRESFLTEGYSKKLSDREIDKQFKSFSKPEEFFGDLDKARAEMKQSYSPSNSARPKAWNSLSYPVRDGDYYFAFISKNEKKNMKFNDQMNDMLKNALKEINKQNKAVKASEVRELLWDKASEMVRKLPKDLGAGDTMTREEIWMSIGHMLGMNEDVQEMRDAMKTRAGIRVGRRAKAPKYESMLDEKAITFGYTFFAKKEMDDFFKLVKSLKGLEILSKDKQTAGHFLVRVKGDRKVVAKANSLAMRAMMAENFRTLAVKGMGAEPFDRVKVGREIDYYEPKNGDKRQGKVIKKDLKRSGTYSVKDMDNGKVHVFKYHDRNAAKKLLRSYKHYEAVEESDASWAKSLETIKRKRQLDKISDKDKKTLQDIMALLDKERKR